MHTKAKIGKDKETLPSACRFWQDQVLKLSQSQPRAMPHTCVLQIHFGARHRCSLILPAQQAADHHLRSPLPHRGAVRPPSAHTYVTRGFTNYSGSAVKAAPLGTRQKRQPRLF